MWVLKQLGLGYRYHHCRSFFFIFWNKSYLLGQNSKWSLVPFSVKTCFRKLMIEIDFTVESILLVFLSFFKWKKKILKDLRVRFLYIIWSIQLREFRIKGYYLTPRSQGLYYSTHASSGNLKYSFNLTLKNPTLSYQFIWYFHQFGEY